MSLKNKRILITAGPTWVPIDSVRVISNIASGETGILLAKKLDNLGAKVTLLLGPVSDCCLDNSINIIRFIFFSELKDKLIKELRSKKYNIVIHSAAVSDYQPLKLYAHKIKSGIKKFRLSLVPTEKMIDKIRKIDESIFLVGFKFGPGLKKELMIKSAKDLIKRANLDLAVANSINKDRYESYIIGNNKIYGPFLNKKYLTEKLINIIARTL